jgi:hypothetical protein
VTKTQRLLAAAAIALAAAVIWTSRCVDDDRSAEASAGVAAPPGSALDRTQRPQTTPHTPPPRAPASAEPTPASGGDERAQAPGPSTPPAEAAADEPAPGGDRDDEGHPPGGAGATPPPAAAGEVATLKKEEIQAAIKAAVPAIKACYEQGLKTTPDLAGRVVVEFDITGGEEGTGVVERGEVSESEAASPFFEACVLQKVSGVEFPAPSGGGKVKVRYPFHFDPGGGFGGAPPQGKQEQ